jgi:hypothetical protein
MLMESETCSKPVSYEGVQEIQHGTHIVKELSTSVPLDVMCVEVTPPQLHIDPVLIAGSAIQNVFTLRIHHQRKSRREIGGAYISDKRRPRDVPLQKDQKGMKEQESARTL